MTLRKGLPIWQEADNQCCSSAAHLWHQNGGLQIKASCMLAWSVVSVVVVIVVVVVVVVVGVGVGVGSSCWWWYRVVLAGLFFLLLLSLLLSLLWLRPSLPLFCILFYLARYRA